MILPTKHSDINYSLLYIGYRILKQIQRKPLHSVDLYLKIKNKYLPELDIALYDDAITLLWLLDCIDYTYYSIDLKYRPKKDTEN